MTILEFDEIDRYQEFREWIVSMTPSQLMRKKREVTDVVWDLHAHASVCVANVDSVDNVEMCITMWITWG